MQCLVLSLQAKTLIKNIYIEGPNAKLVTNPVVITEVKAADGHTLTMTDPEVTFADPETVPRVTIQPVMHPEDASQ